MLAECPDWAVENYYQEFPLVFPALSAGLEGIVIDTEKFREVAAKKQEEVEEVRKRLSYLLGVPDFNPNSPVQVSNLFKLLGVHLGSTDKSAMLKAKASHPLADMLLSLVTEYREASKLLGTYFKEGKLWNGRLFYTFNPGGTDTGRLACIASAFWCGFQIQNIPRGDILKQCFLSEPGWFWAEPDKAQSEARCVGYLSGDKNLIELVESDKDYHSWNAQAFFGVPYELIWDQEHHKTLDKVIRDLAKRTNHGANYNMGAQVMLDTMGPRMVAKAKKVLKLPAHYTLFQVCDYLLARYEATYPDVKQTWYQKIVSTIEVTKKLVSPFGWTRQFFGSPRKNKQALNAAVAHGPQNLSVAIINREWYSIWRETLYGKLRNRVRVKAQIHDSLPFIYRDRAAAYEVQAMMNTEVPVTDARGITRILRIPTDMSLGPEGGATRWSEVK
jgi:DNA polymerase I-like protein with 3'-5' exonuclease and polymerase domains